MPAQLSRGQHATIAAVADAVAPPDCGLAVSARDVDVAGALETLLADFAPSTRRMVRLMTAAVRYDPLLRGRLATFNRLPASEREAALRRMLDQPGLTHEAAVALRALCDMVFAGDGRFREAVGDDGAPAKPDEPLPPETDLPVIQHPELSADTTVECDVAIVGSGAGGATIARELAAAGLDVAVIEEGGPAHRSDFHGPPLDRIAAHYRDNGMTVTVGTPSIPVPMGCAVGGTTVVNSGTCLRAPDAVLEDWARRHGVKLAAPEAMSAAYDLVAERLNIQPVGDAIMGNNGRLVTRGAEELGLHPRPIPRPTRGCAGQGQCCCGCPRDAKQAMHLTHLPAAVADGARIYARCRVDTLYVNGRWATSVSARILDAAGRPTGHRLAVRAKAIFLCAGALWTPVLLARHGLGRASGQLGRNLRIHPGSGVTARFAERVDGWRGVMQSVSVDDRLDDGVLLEATFPPLGLSYSAGGLPGVGAEHAALLGQYAYMASIGSIVSDTSAGRVRVVPGLGPIMQYRMNATDAGRTASAIALASRILFAAGAQEVYTGVAAAPILRTVGDVAAFEATAWAPRDLKVSAYHPMGTARMGEDPRDAVCDATGRVHGTDNLYVADTSLFPNSTRVNPQFTLMALCLNLARRFLEDWPGVAARA